MPRKLIVRRESEPPAGRPPHTAQRWRRPAGGAVITAALLVVAAVSVPRATPGETAGRGGSSAAPADVRPSSSAPLFVQFVDRDHGFAMTARCPGGEKHCSYGLAVSTDGGRSYQHRPLPLAKIAPPEGYGAELHAVTARTVVIEDRGEWWVSIDAGHTWRSAPDSVVARAVEIPAAGRLHTRCADPNCDSRELTVIDPDTGRRRRAPDVPLERIYASSESTVAPDGTRWVSGTVRGDVPALATTRDGGHTWSVSRFPGVGRMLRGPRLLVGPGSLRYAVFSVQREDAKNGFGPLYASADAGRTWTRIRDGDEQPASILGAIVRPDGRLLIGTELDGPMISADGGRSFTPLRTGPAVSGFIERSGMITALRDDGGYATSQDGGTTWSPVSVPAP
jgi:photosystem II stability/assembly factor-like uncharacterized protein